MVRTPLDEVGVGIVRLRRSSASLYSGSAQDDIRESVPAHRRSRTTTGSSSARESAAAAEHVVEGDGAGTEKDQGECECCGGHGELVPGAIGRAQ